MSRYDRETIARLMATPCVKPATLRCGFCGEWGHDTDNYGCGEYNEYRQAEWDAAQDAADKQRQELLDAGYCDCGNCFECNIGGCEGCYYGVCPTHHICDEPNFGKNGFDLCVACHQNEPAGK